MTTSLSSWVRSVAIAAMVTSIMLAGSLPAGHIFFMETKEHIFLVLPFLAISIALCASYLRTTPDDALRKSTAFLTLIALGVGAATAAAGIIVSGSV